MATQSFIPVKEYRETFTEPDCEFVNGVNQERSMPERDHAAWQKALIRWFVHREREWGIDVFPGITVQTKAGEFAVPDVTILTREPPREQVVTYPPMAVFEILSPKGIFTTTLETLARYEAMGIPEIWVIDPKNSACYRYSSGQLTPTVIFDLPGTGFSVAMSRIAALVD